MASVPVVYNLRSLRQRPLSTLATALGLALVVAVFIADEPEDASPIGPSWLSAAAYCACVCSDSNAPTKGRFAPFW